MTRATRQRPTESVEDRFWERVTKGDGCWLWSGASGNGYGRLTPVRGSLKYVYAHRYSYELHKGPIPDGLTIDHLCRNRRCVNPDHLEAVTNAENIRRGAAAQTHCKWGHEFTPENTWHLARGERLCRTCDRERRKRRG